MSKTLERISKNDDSDIDNLTNFLTIALDLKTSFETKILKKYLEDGKFVLFLDGLDEVSIYEKEVIKLIRKLNEISKENKIFLSSRPLETLLRNIKNEFNVASCKLQPFERFDQSEFLKKFWKVNMESFSENSFENFIETLLKNLKKKINDSGIEFSSIALHLYMIAVTFKKRFENFNTSKFDEMYYHQNQYTDDISKISELYKSFIRTKCYEIFYDDKLKIERSVKGIKNMAECYFNSFIEKNKLLALNSMFSDDQINLLLDRKSLGELEKYKIEIENSGEDIGIVVHIVDKKPFYVHKTFAEYFIADFFISLFNDENVSEKSPAVNFFFKNILDESNSTLCYFFNDMLNSEINGKIEKFGIVDIVKDLDVKILFDAISYEWQNIVKLLVNNDIDMMNTNQSKDSVLHSAIFKCHDVLGNDENENEILNTILEKLKEKPETLKKLLEAEDFMGYTPMFNVVQYANLKIVEKLFEIILDFKILNLNNVQGMFCSNLLHTAAQNPNKDVFQFVLSKINTNTDSLLLQNYFLETDRSKNTPLITAIECGQINTAKTLIEQYKSSNTLRNVIAIKNDYNDNILHIAARRLGENFIQIIVEELNKYPETLKKLLRDKNLDGDAPFFLSIEYGAFDDLKFFVDTFESLNIAESAFLTTNDENENMLHLAARKENDCLEFLLEHLDNYPEVFKYLFKKESEYEVNPLFDAASMDNIKNMKLLIKKIHELKIFETAVSVQNSNKYNILHLIVRKDNDILKYFLEEIKMYPDILKKLLQQRNKDGSTPLFLAVRFDCINNVKTIIESFYDMNMLKDALNSEDLNNNNVLHLAVLKKNKDCLPFVLEKLKEYPDILKKFILNDNLEGLTPLFVAVYFDNLNSVECLVKICKDLGVLEKAVDFQNSDYCTVLHLAAKNKSDDCFRFLLEEIIDFQDTLKKILETKKDGLTPIFLIVQNGHMGVMNGLIEAFRKLDILKSAISAVNDDEENIMHLSAKMESDDFLQLIIEELKNDKDVLETLVQMPNKKGETPLVLAERQNYVIDLS